MKDHPYPRERIWSDCEAEIERLRREHEKVWADVALKDAEIARLRDELEIWKSVFPDIAPEQVQPDRSVLLAEIERLRAALEKIARKGGETNAHGHALQQIAREAIGDVPHP